MNLHIFFPMNEEWEKTKKNNRDQVKNTIYVPYSFYQPIEYLNVELVLINSYKYNFKHNMTIDKMQ